MSSALPSSTPLPPPNSGDALLRPSKHKVSKSISNSEPSSSKPTSNLTAVRANLTKSDKSNRVNKSDNKGPHSEEGELTRILAGRVNAWASEIIPNQLWLGSGTDASKLEELEKRNIKHVLNVADDVPNFHGHKIKYLNLNVVDFGQDSGISRTFENAFKFLQEAQDNKEPVLVHCAAGANRSATIVIAWLMKSNHWTLLQSWLHVKSARHGVVPLKDNRLQLLEFEKTLFEKPSMNKDEFLGK
jgi:atypical dual specificity phosphatase